MPSTATPSSTNSLCSSWLPNGPVRIDPEPARARPATVVSRQPERFAPNISANTDSTSVSSRASVARRLARRASTRSMSPAMRLCSARAGKRNERLRQRAVFRLEMFVVCWPKLRTVACMRSEENQRYKYPGSIRLGSARRTETNPPKVVFQGSCGIQQHLPTRFQLLALETKMSPVDTI